MTARAVEEAAPEEAPAPTFEPPPMPETELSAEDKAAREAEAAAAEAAIAQAEDAEGVVSAYATAPPTVKATTQSMIGGRIGEVIAADQQEFEASLPEFHATMTGGGVAEPVAEVTAPTPEPVAVASKRKRLRRHRNRTCRRCRLRSRMPRTTTSVRSSPASSAMRLGRRDRSIAQQDPDDRPEHRDDGG